MALGLAGAAAEGISPATAQQQRASDATTEAVSRMPPALRAAVLSGNADAIRQAIATLAGNDSALAAQLANQVVRAAEQIFATDPRGGIRIAQVAVTAISSNRVQQAAPQQTQDVITTAARLFINPAAQAAAPEATAQLAMTAVQAATTSNNAALVTSTAGQAVTVAERMLSTNATTAIQMAGIAVEAIRHETVQTTATAAGAAMDVAVAAARVVLSPSAQASTANTEAVAAIKESLTVIATAAAANPVTVANPTAVVNPATVANPVAVVNPATVANPTSTEPVATPPSQLAIMLNNNNNNNNNAAPPPPPPTIDIPVENNRRNAEGS